MHAFLATYVHHFDPFAIQFTETFGVRWYGLAYVAGFVAAFFMIRWFVRIGASELKEDQVVDFVTWVALFGTMLGGRLGYMLFYNFGELISNPLSFFNLLGGGMSSHGGIAGMCLVALVYSWKKKISWTGLGDSLVVVAPLGVFFGRLANFVNGELFGRKTDHVWAMKFPEELHEIEKLPGGGVQYHYSMDQLRALAERGSEAIPDLVQNFDHTVSDAMASGHSRHFEAVSFLKKAAWENETFRSMLGEILNPRHPSQLYEAAVEGLIPFFLLLAIRVKWPNLYHGIITGIFFLIYSVGRIAVENFREPDADLIMGVTRGQFYSGFMFIMGIAFLAFALIRKRRNQLPAGVGAKK